MGDPKGSCPRGGRHAWPSVNPQYMKMFVLILRKWSEHTGPNSLWQAGPVPMGRERALVCALLLSNKRTPDWDQKTVQALLEDTL